MPTPDSIWIYVSTISLYLVVLLVPGLLIGAAAGMRGWSLAGIAPLLTYTATGLAGPWLFQLGLPYNVATALASIVLLAGLAAGLRALALRRGWASTARERAPSAWTGKAHLAVTACVVLATVLSVIVVLSASGGPSAVFQRWDTVFHANGIRYIADTGDGSLFGMSTINYYDPGGAQFYPNAYHLVGALVYTLSGATIPSVLNAITVPIAGIFALSLVALVRQFGGRATFAGASAIVAAAATTGAYESVSSGLLPFALGIVLTPLAALVLQRFLVRPGIDTGFVLALAAVGLLAAHSSSLFGAILFTLPMLAQRWWRRDGKPLVDLRRLVPAALAAAALAAPHLIGAVQFSSGSYPYTPWASDIALVSALGQLLMFRQVLEEPQFWLAVLLVVGILSIRSLGKLRWVGTSALVLSTLFVVVACFGATPWVIALSRPWWNDRYRLMAMAAIPLCLLAGHGLAQLQRWLAKLVGSWAWVQARPRVPARLGMTSATSLAVALALLTHGFYTQANATAVAYAYHNGPEAEDREPPVTGPEVTAMLQLRKYVGPGEKVLNGRVDGTAWMYAIAGIHPVAGSYDPGVPPTDAKYLANHFREYKTDPEVRAALDRLNVHHVMIGHGKVKSELSQESGLTDLEGLSFLREEYRNKHAAIYTITG